MIHTCKACDAPVQGSYGSRYAKLVAEKEQSSVADTASLADVQSASLDTPKLWTKQGWPQDKDADGQHYRLQEQVRDTDFLQDEQPHRVSSTRQVDWCHGKGGARRMCAVCRHVASPSQRMPVSTRYWRMPLVGVHAQEPLAPRSESAANAWLTKVRRDRITVQPWCYSCFLLDP